MSLASILLPHSGFLLEEIIRGGALFKNSGGPPPCKKGGNYSLGGKILKVVDTMHWAVPGSRTPVFCALTTFAIHYATALWCDPFYHSINWNYFALQIKIYKVLSKINTTSKLESFHLRTKVIYSPRDKTILHDLQW